MSKKALSDFKTKLAEDEALRNELTSVLSAGGTKTTASTTELIAFANARGYDFSPEEARETLELSDQELDRVAGGGATIEERAHIPKTEAINFNVESFSLSFIKH